MLTKNHIFFNNFSFTSVIDGAKIEKKLCSVSDIVDKPLLIFYIGEENKWIKDFLLPEKFINVGEGTEDFDVPQGLVSLNKHKEYKPYHVICIGLGFPFEVFELNVISPEWTICVVSSIENKEELIIAKDVNLILNMDPFIPTRNLNQNVPEEIFILKLVKNLTYIYHEDNKEIIEGELIHVLEKKSSLSIRELRNFIIDGITPIFN